MNWVINPVVTVNGTDYTADTLNGVSITYGRGNIWEQPRAAYASIQILNDDNSPLSVKLNDLMVIKVDNSTASQVTLFTGKVTSVSSTVSRIGTSAEIIIHTVNGISPLGEMNRVITGTSAWPKEYDDDRLDRILTDSGVTIDIVDTPGVYEFTAITPTPSDCYYWASYYAQMAFGYLYDTTDGKVGYANESRRTLDAANNGYFTIPENVILSGNLQSTLDTNNLLNDVRLEYKNNQIVTSTSASSISTFGKRASDILTELEDSAQAQNQADRYITLRSTPETILPNFTVQLSAPTITAGVLDGLLGLYIGKPIQVADFPDGIFNGIFKGFVEGWSFVLNRNVANVSLNVSKNTLSITPTRWQDVSASLQWEDVDPVVEWSDYE